MPSPALRVSQAAPFLPIIPGSINVAVRANGEAMERLLRLAQVLRVGRDQEIYPQGGNGEFCYRLISGVVRTVALMRDGRRQVGEFYLADDVFGLDSEERRSFGAEAVTDCTMLRFSTRRVALLADGDAAFSNLLCRLMRRQLRETREQILLLGRKTATERVATFLLEMEARAGDGPDVVALPMSRGDIADHLGLTVETVSRVLSRLHRDGAIALESAHRVIVTNRDTLLSAAELH